MRIRRRLPATLRGRLLPGERMLAWGVADGDGAPAGLDAVPDSHPRDERNLVVVTTRRLFAPGLAEPLAWERVVRAAWDDPVLSVTSQAGPAATTEVNIVIVEAGTVPAHVRARVATTIIVQRHLALGEGRGATFIARRRPGGDDVSWTVLFDPGLDPGDPDLRGAADAALAEFRTVVGI